MSTSNGSISGSQYAKAISINRRIPPSLIVGSKYPPEKKKVKKMNWFKRKFAQWSREAWENSRNEEYVDTVVSRDNSISGKTSVRFTIYPASGGYVIEHYKQDRYKENDGPSLTIVNNGDELGKAVEHILTMEALKA